MKTFRIIARLCSLVALLATVNPTVRAAGKFITIGTGAVTGVYYPLGGAICRLVNKDQKSHGFRCTAQSTSGSVYNVNGILAGELDAGVAQSDVQYNALNGLADFKNEGPSQDLRAVFSIYHEPLTIVARKDSGIKKFDDLKGKRVNVGNPGSGSRTTMEALMALKGWKMSDFAVAAELKPAEQSEAMCDKKVEAILYVVGHPNGSILEATTACDSVLVDVSGPEVDKLVEDNPYYAKAVIPGGMYRGNPKDTNTFGVKATLVSSARVPADTVYALVKAVFDNFEEFRGLHPSFTSLKKETLISDGNTAPLHDGSIRYFNEAGLLK
jgi:TRAP transporter TAXI family solute receptor